MTAGSVRLRLLHAARRAKFYWHRLRGERITKSLGIGLAVFALVLQSAAVFIPSPAANATSTDPNDNIIYQGASGKAALLGIYDQNRDSAGHTDIQAIYSRIGITRADLANATEGTYYTDDFNGGLNTLGRLNWHQPNRMPLDVTGASTAVYTGGFLQNYNHIHYAMTPALIGHRAVDGQWFAITLDCGNVVYVTLPPTPKPVKDISVCRNGQVITIKETERQTGDLEATSPQCQPASFKCDALQVTPITRTSGGTLTKANFTTATSANNATLSSVTYVVRDSAGNEVSRSSDSTFAPQQAGTYTVQSYATFTAKGQSQTVTSDNCQATLSVPAENQITVCRPGQGDISIKQSERLSTDLPAGDQACHPQPAAPVVELPKTGSGDMVVSALGLGLLSAASYFYWDSRRLLGRA